MKPAKPFHINYPGAFAKEPDYEVVGHRDGPVVARFPFDPKEPEYREQALAEAKALVARSQGQDVPQGLMGACREAAFLLKKASNGFTAPERIDELVLEALGELIKAITAAGGEVP